MSHLCLGNIKKRARERERAFRESLLSVWIACLCKIQLVKAEESDVERRWGWWRKILTRVAPGRGAVWAFKLNKREGEEREGKLVCPSIERWLCSGAPGSRCGFRGPSFPPVFIKSRENRSKSAKLLLDSAHLQNWAMLGCIPQVFFFMMLGSTHEVSYEDHHHHCHRAFFRSLKTIYTIFYFNILKLLSLSRISFLLSPAGAPETKKSSSFPYMCICSSIALVAIAIVVVAMVVVVVVIVMLVSVQLSY